jgi:outer membrane protein assembly factor BamB
LLVLSLCTAAADWPRFGGPTGDFQISPLDSPLRWPDGGPKRLWERPLGEGYSGIVVEGSSLYTMFRREDKQEVVVRLDTETGKTRWEYAYDAPLPADYDRFNSTGPRATPLIAGDRLFTAGAGGKLHCLDRKTGKVIWSRDIVKDFHGQIRINGYAASPIAWRDTVIVLPWAPDGAIMALRLSDGSVVWKKHSFMVSYATPMVIKFAGHEQLIAQFSDEVTGLNPDSGELLWSFPHTNDQKVNASSPVWSNDGFMFLSSAYSGAGRMLHLFTDGSATKVEEVWSQRLVRVHHSDAVRIGDIIYASSGDNGPCPLAAAEFKTGKVLWRDRSFPKASLIAIGNQLLILDEDGNLALATPGEKGLDVHGKIAVLKSNAWTPPTLVGKRVYMRDRSTIVSFSFE